MNIDIQLEGESVNKRNPLWRKNQNELEDKDYIELYNWLVGLGFPEKHSQFREYVKSQAWRTGGQKKQKEESLGQVSDASLFVLDSNNNPNQEILFKDAFPIALSGLDFDISGGDTPYFVGLASFKYRIFNIKSVT